MTEGSTTVITGSLGGGKTLYGAGMMMDRLSRGATCITNVVVYPEKIAQWIRDEFGLIFDPARLVILSQASIRNFHELAVRGNDENATFMLLDESALDLNSRDWQTLSRDLFNFVVLCRKLGIELCLIAQDATDIDKQLRKKMQREVHCRSLKNLPFLGAFKLPIFIRVTYVLTVGSKPWRTGVNMTWKGDAWGYFDSKALHGEKALQFNQLAVAKSERLGRVQFDPVTLWAPLLGAFFSALIVLL